MGRWRYAKLSLSSALFYVARVLGVCTIHPLFIFSMFPARPCILSIPTFCPLSFFVCACVMCVCVFSSFVFLSSVIFTFLIYF